MPANEHFDTTHEKMKIDNHKPYGCSNKPRPVHMGPVKNYLSKDEPTHPFRMSTLCAHAIRAFSLTDSRCEGCQFQKDGLDNDKVNRYNNQLIGVFSEDSSVESR